MSCGAKLAVGKVSYVSVLKGQDCSADEEAAVVWKDHKTIICPRMQRGAYGV